MLCVLCLLRIVAQYSVVIQQKIYPHDMTWGKIVINLLDPSTSTKNG